MTSLALAPNDRTSRTGTRTSASLGDIAIRRSGEMLHACLANIATVPDRHPIRSGFGMPHEETGAREPMSDLAFFGASFASGFVIFFGMIV